MRESDTLWNNTKSDEEMIKYIRSPSYRGSVDSEFNLSRRKDKIMSETFDEQLQDRYYIDGVLYYRYNTDREFNGEDLKRLAREMNLKLSTRKIYDLARNHIDVLYEEFTKNDHKLRPQREQRHQYLRKNSSRESTIIRNVRRSMEINASHAGVACELSRLLGFNQIGSIEWLQNKFKVLENQLLLADEKLYEIATKRGGYLLEEDFYIKEEWRANSRAEDLDYHKMHNIYFIKCIVNLESMMKEAVNYKEPTYYIRMIIDVVAGYRHGFLIANQPWKHEQMHNLIRTMLEIGFHKTKNGINAITQTLPNSHYVSREGLMHEVYLREALLGFKFPEDMETLKEICARVEPHMPIYS